jgi:mono/diheme cytochrome c family protein
VIALSALFAFLRNTGPTATQPAAPAAPSTAPSAAPSADSRGRAAFERMNCLACHSLAGRGEGIPLDGVGARLNRTQLRDWVLGSGTAAQRLPKTVVTIKQHGAGDPDIEGLLDYLQQLR